MAQKEISIFDEFIKRGVPRETVEEAASHFARCLVDLVRIVQKEKAKRLVQQKASSENTN